MIYFWAELEIVRLKVEDFTPPTLAQVKQFIDVLDQAEARHTVSYCQRFRLVCWHCRTHVTSPWPWIFNVKYYKYVTSVWPWLFNVKYYKIFIFIFCVADTGDSTALYTTAVFKITKGWGKVCILNIEGQKFIYICKLLIDAIFILQYLSY